MTAKITIKPIHELEQHEIRKEIAQRHLNAVDFRYRGKMAYIEGSRVSIPNWPENLEAVMGLVKELMSDHETDLVLWFENTESHTGPMALFSDDPIEFAMGSPLIDVHYIDQLADMLARLCLHRLRNI